jgi:hypothetical protein
MQMPHWPLIGMLVLSISQMLLAWSNAKKAGKRVRHAALPWVLLVAANVLIVAVESMVNMPEWLAWVLVVALFILLILLFGIGLVRGKRHLQDAWQIDKKPR